MRAGPGPVDMGAVRSTHTADKYQRSSYGARAARADTGRYRLTDWLAVVIDAMRAADLPVLIHCPDRACGPELNAG